MNSAPESASSARQREAIEACCELTAALASDVSRDELLHVICAKLCTLLGIQRCSVYLRENDTELFRGQVAETGQGHNDAAIKRLVCGGLADAFTREIVKTRRPVFIADAQRDSRPVRSAIYEWGVRSMLGVPMIADDEVVGLLFLDNHEERRKFTDEEQELASAFATVAANTIRLARASEALRSSAVNVARQNKMLRREGLLEEQLRALVLEGAAIDAIAASITEFTGMSCAIHDADHRRVASANSSDTETRMRSLLDRDVLDGPAGNEVRATLRSDEVTVVGPFMNARLPRRFIVAPIAAENEHLGHLVVAEAGRSISAFDRAVARRGASAAALRLAAARQAKVAENQAREALARDLLEGNVRGSGLRARAEFHGVRLDQPHVVAVLQAEDGAPAPTCAEVETAFRAADHGGALLCVDDDEGAVVALLELSKIEQSLERSRYLRHLMRCAMESLGSKPTHILGAVSSPCLLPGECPRALEEARQVLGCVRSVGGDPGGFLIADELGVGRLLLTVGDRREAERFALHILGPLFDGDHDGGSSYVPDLLLTLSAFFESCCSIRLAADALNVHGNTVRYRLSRITEITGLDPISNADHQLSIQLALLVLRLNGRLPFHEAADKIETTGNTEKVTSRNGRLGSAGDA